MDKKVVSLRINDIPVTVPEDSTVLGAAHSAGFNIPSLCFLRDINEIDACRVCMVEVKEAKNLITSYVYPVAEGMEVYTSTERVRESHQPTLELILSSYQMGCLTYSRNSHCELLQLAGDLGIDAVQYVSGNIPSQIEASAPHLVRDSSKCIPCRRCTAVCHKTQKMGVIGPSDRGFHTHIDCAFDRDLTEVDHASYDQCIVACPTGALSKKGDTVRVLVTLNNPAKHVVMGPTPSTRVTLGECLGLPIGINVGGKMVTALHRLDFDEVFDVDTATDFTILEEDTEFLSRLNGGSTLPLITSCSPGWVRYLEQHAPDMIRNISSCKSSQQMFGSLVEAYYAEQAGMNPQDIFVVSIMPYTIKKCEVLREEQRLPNGYVPVDISLTTRELGRMITQTSLLFERLPDGAFDLVLGVSTDAAAIFGVSGNVMEAALRTVIKQLTGEGMAPLKYQEVRSMEEVKETSYELPGKTVQVCVASGLHSVKRVLDGIRDSSLQYDLVEFMAYPGGCINGDDQPIQHVNVRSFTSIKTLRAAALYKQDEGMTYRRSHENPVVQKVYADFLNEPGDHKAHALLHCSYIKQKRYRV